jgi:hypothetical protein
LSLFLNIFHSKNPIQFYRFLSLFEVDKKLK